MDGSLLAQLKIEAIIVNTLKSSKNYDENFTHLKINIFSFLADAAGSYENVTYTSNVDGTKISDILIQGKDEITIKLF